MDNNQCKVCGNSDGNNKLYVAKEMMFGFRDEFVYFQCNKCGCLQIKDIPDTLERYYPKSYWMGVDEKKFQQNKPLKNFLVKQRTNFLLGKPNLFGERLYNRTTIAPTPVFGGWNWAEDFKKARLDVDSAILDVGCADGQLLCHLQKQGFSNLIGIDAYIEDNIFLGGIKIYKKELKDLDGEFDFITMHHSFEHMAEPNIILEHLFRLLKSQRYLLIRIPLVSCFAWEKYGVNWVQLDAPRHLFLHTPESIRILCDRVGFHVENIIYDSNEFQFWASEGYLKDIPLKDNKASNYSSEELKSFKIQAQELNEKQQGDQACFYLYKP